MISKIKGIKIIILTIGMLVIGGCGEKIEGEGGVIKIDEGYKKSGLAKKGYSKKEYMEYEVVKMIGGGEVEKGIKQIEEKVLLVEGGINPYKDYGVYNFGENKVYSVKEYEYGKGKEPVGKGEIIGRLKKEGYTKEDKELGIKKEEYKPKGLGVMDKEYKLMWGYINGEDKELRDKVIKYEKGRNIKYIRYIGERQLTKEEKRIYILNTEYKGGLGVQVKERVTKMDNKYVGINLSNGAKKALEEVDDGGVRKGDSVKTYEEWVNYIKGIEKAIEKGDG